MHRLSVMLTVVCAVIGLARTGAAQGYQGGIRGAVHDAAGVVPGAEVTVINEETNVARSTVTNAAGEYNLPNLAPGLYGIKVAMSGFKAVTQSGVQIGTQQFLTLDMKLEVGGLEETVNVTSEPARIERSNASIGTVLDKTDMQTLPSPGRAAFLIGTTRADGDSLRRRPVQPPAGPDQRLAAVARRRHPPWQQLHARRRPDHGPAQPRHRQPEHRVARGHEGAGPHLRCRDGPHRRRRVQHDAAGRRQQPARHRLRADPPDLGPDQQLLQREGRARQAGQPVLPRRRRHRRAGAPQPHVLLVLDRELPRRPDAQRQRHDADGARTPRRLLADDQRRRRARDHLRSADRPAVRRQPDPGQPHQPDGRGDAAVPAARRRRALERLDQLHAHVAHQEPVPAALLGQGVAQVERHEHPHGLLSLQQDRRARRQLLRHRRPVRADAVRRSARLHPGAAAEDPRAERHLGDERQLGARPALRDDALPGQQHAQRALRPERARLLADVSRPDHAGEVPRRPHPRLRPVRLADARRHQPDPDQLEVDQRQRHLVDVRRPPHLQGRRRLPPDRRRQLHPGRRRRLLRLRQGHDVVERRHRQHHRRQRLRVVPARLSVDGPHQPDLGVDAARSLRLLLRRLRAGRLARQLEADPQLRPAHRARGRPARSGEPLHGRLRSGDVEPAVVDHDPGRPDRRHAGAHGVGRPDVCRRRRQQDDPGQRPGGEMVTAR